MLIINVDYKNRYKCYLYINLCIMLLLNKEVDLGIVYFNT